MFTNISWATYIISVAIAMLLWYTLISLNFYYQDIMGFLKGKQRLQPNAFWETPSNEDESMAFGAMDNLVPKGSFEDTALNDFEIVEELVDRTKSLINDMAEKSISKQDFYKQLAKILSEYPTLRQSQFRPSVNEFIVSECEMKELKGITMEEMESLWVQ